MQGMIRFAIMEDLKKMCLAETQRDNERKEKDYLAQNAKKRYGLNKRRKKP
jgi:hypothetical protein